MNTTLFHITGGLGKHVLFTSILNSYKHQYPNKNIIISSAYPEIFEKNPNIYESLNLSKNQYFYKNYIHNKDIEIFAQEPYKQSDHILKRKHLVETWCDLIGIKHTSKSSLNISFTELSLTEKLLKPYNNKPILVFQPFGGPFNNQNHYCWARDIPPLLAQEIVNKYHKEYNVLHICNPHHPILNNCIRVEERLHPNILFSILLYSQKRILIDSCLQHACFALSLPSTVFWIVTDPKIFGYDLHKNIICDSPILKREGHANSYFFDYEINGNIPECPFSNPYEIFPKNILNHI